MAKWPWLLAAAALAGPAVAATLSGGSAYGDWRTDAPGVWRKLTPSDLPPAVVGLKVALPAVVARPQGAVPKTLPGFSITEFAKLEGPRQVRVAPNGDVFVAETGQGKVVVLRAGDGAAKAEHVETFAEELDRPFGLAFYPLVNPQWVYVGNATSVVRYPYRAGDLKARGKAETVVASLPHGGEHFTRDIAFSADGKTMFVSVGTYSNVGEEMPKKNPAETAEWQKTHALGAAWDHDENRADVLAFDADGKGQHVFAAGLRNCVSMKVNPQTKALWCVVNERDLTGDDLPPDYATQVKPGGFYGWPWYYTGDHEDPRRAGERPDLKGKVTTPDVLIQPHSAPLGITFYEPRGSAAFPAEYRGDAFVTLHGSWNRSKRTGYKLVRLKLANGQPTGEYEDFMTGFVVDDHGVWGRPVGVAEARDGALLVSDDGSGIVWRIAYAHH